jgi:hypothetical protein
MGGINLVAENQECLSGDVFHPGGISMMVQRVPAELAEVVLGSFVFGFVGAQFHLKFGFCKEEEFHKFVVVIDAVGDGQFIKPLPVELGKEVFGPDEGVGRDIGLVGRFARSLVIGGIGRFRIVVVGHDGKRSSRSVSKGEKEGSDKVDGISNWQYELQERYCSRKRVVYHNL